MLKIKDSFKSLGVFNLPLKKTKMLSIHLFVLLVVSRTLLDEYTQQNEIITGYDAFEPQMGTQFQTV